MKPESIKQEQINKFRSYSSEGSIKNINDKIERLKETHKLEKLSETLKQH